MCAAALDPVPEMTKHVGVLSDDIAVLKFPITKASPADAVPAGRIGYDISAEHLLLHTIQTAEAFDTLCSAGVLVSDPSRIDPFHVEAYDWLYLQMAARLTATGCGAVWFWARITRQDLVERCRYSVGKVLLTCKVPRERVLLSHFGDWHAVLNTFPHLPEIPGESDEGYTARREQVLDDFEARLRSAGAWGAGIADWPADLRTEVEQGWENILDPMNYGRFESWQATAHALHADDVLEAVRIV
jgi:hypothetical protein